MRLIPIVVHDAFSQTNRYLGLMVLSNIGATFLSVPIAVLAIIALLIFHGEGLLPLLLVALIGIFPSPTTAGIQFLAHETAQRNPVFWRDQIDGIRKYGWLAFRCWLISSTVGILLAANTVFYFQHHVPLGGLIASGWMVALMWWTVCHLYVYPLILEQEDKRIFLIYRNALLIALARPLFTIVVGTLWLITLLVLSFTALIGIFGLILCAQIQQNAAAVILPTFDQAPSE